MQSFQDASPMLTSGQFAELCQTSKATLRHYRDIGLLVPAVVLDNGYAAYSPMQAADFRLIEALASSGCPLSSIIEYLKTPDEAALKDVLSSCVESIVAQREALLQQQILLERTLRRAAMLASWEVNGSPWKIEHCEEEKYFEVDLSSFLCNQDADSVLGNLGNALAMVPAEPLQGAYCIERAAFLGGDYAQGMRFLRSASALVEEGVKVKPAGIYLKHLRTTTLASEMGAASPIFAEYDAFKRYIDECALQTAGDLYEEELSIYSGNANATVYSEISIMIAE